MKVKKFFISNDIDRNYIALSKAKIDIDVSINEYEKFLEYIFTHLNFVHSL